MQFKHLDPDPEPTGAKPVPEFIDPVFAKTSHKRSFSVIENERFGLVFAKTGSINSGSEPILLISTILTKCYVEIAKRSYKSGKTGIYHFYFFLGTRTLPAVHSYL